MSHPGRCAAPGPPGASPPIAGRPRERPPSRSTPPWPPGHGRLGGVNLEGSGVYMRRDGSRVPVLIIGMALLGDAGDQCIALALPLIERQTSAEVLRASEARLAGIIASVTDAIITIDAERRIVVFNAAAERMLRCSAAEALGPKIDRFLPERVHAAHAE